MLSLEAARKHLLRHFYDLRELERNPLAAPFFHAARVERRPAPEHAALLDIHRAIRKIVDDYERTTLGQPERAPLRRQLWLFKGYVFDRRKPEELAAELGLSRRQFFRDYNAARDRILSGFIASGVAVSADELLDVEEAPIFQASLLTEATLVSDAIERLQQVVETTERLDIRVQALCALARVEIDEARYDEAIRTMRRIDVIPTAVLRAECAYLNDLLHWRTSTTERIVPGATPEAIRCDPVNKKLSRIYIDYLIARGERLSWQGEFDKAAGDFDRARALLDTQVRPSIKHRVMLSRHYADMVATRYPDDIPRAVAILSDAIALARSNGLLRSAIQASASLASCHNLDGDRGTGDKVLLQCIETCCRFGDSAMLGSLYADLGDVLTDDEPTRALEYLTQARRLLPENDVRMAGTYVMMSIANMGVGRPMDALQYAQLASSASTMHGNLRIQGAALRQSALAYFKLGDRTRAGESIRNSIDMLEAHGPKRSLARAYQTCAVITGDVRFAAKAASLHVALPRIPA
jgi:tetratricopeptide (TPR) repeat protein